ncbi:methylmalonyl-CoA epimerase, mitochondrial-like isoform X2 [Dysidea avara]|uniref:methylmalonyl-CoA epimerase, mitochondrial-like isoform X2 n=1 Tax=Dysidea avara TaxID=196820 RepID=UPI00331F3ECA
MAARFTRLATNGLNQSIRALSNRHTACAHYGSTLQTRRHVSSKLWNLGKLNHIAVAVPDLEKASALYRDVFGATVSEAVPLPAHGVTTVFVDLGNTKIELLHPLGDNSPIQSFLDRKPEGGMHHICIEVDDIKAAMESVQSTIRLLNQHPKIGAHGKPVVFLHPKDCDGVLVELEEK